MAKPVRPVELPEPFSQRLALLDAQAHIPREQQKILPPADETIQGSAAFDVGLLGGGLSLMHALTLAQAGLRVAVVERGRVGVAHREWNASAKELEELVTHGVVSAEQLDRLIVARYRQGLCRWHHNSTQRVQNVLDCAVDAQGLLDLIKNKLIELGVTFFEHTESSEISAAQKGLVVALRDSGSEAIKPPLYASVLLDGRGAHSPFARADLVCPTVGGVLEGLVEGSSADTIDPGIGEILATTEGMEDGRQHLWEAFPVGRGRVAVYLFYYTERSALPRTPLAQLYRRFWQTLPRYKRGSPTLVRPTFGLIPGWSRLCEGPKSPHRRLVLVGDAAARHSPLTFCGFGATLRSIASVRNHVLSLCGRPSTDSKTSGMAVDDRAVHGLTGALTLVMSRFRGRPDGLNELLSAAFSTLAQMGEEHLAALLRDEMTSADVIRFLWRTSRRHPAVWSVARQALGTGELLRWTARSTAGLLKT